MSLKCFIKFYKMAQIVHKICSDSLKRLKSICEINKYRGRSYCRKPEYKSKLRLKINFVSQENATSSLPRPIGQCCLG